MSRGVASADVAVDRSPMTMQELAALAGVSTSTVSRALRGHPGVTPATAIRIRELAQVHRFQPNRSAARLRQGRTQTVAVAVPALNTWYFSEVVAGAQTVLARSGFDSLVAVVSGPESMERILRDALPQTGRVDGVVIVDMVPPPTLMDELVDARTRVLTIGRSTPRASSVMIDDIAVGHTATAHLLGLGHRTVGILSGRSTSAFRFDVPDRRRHGHLRALAEAGVDPGPGLEAVGNFNVLGGRDAAHRLLARVDRPSALFCMSDQMAVGAIQAARELGCDVPGDLSIVGVDNHPVAASLGLTTIRQNVKAIGARAAELLVAQLEDATGISHEVLPTELIVRHTTRRR